MVYPLKFLVLEANRLLDRYDDVVWLIGDARSGTTWVSSLINADGRRREMFEPCNPYFSTGFTDEIVSVYLKPGDEHPVLEDFLGRVFAGRAMSSLVDRDNHAIGYHGIIIKDIYANFFASWACDRFPRVRPVCLIRHPIDVARSKVSSRFGFLMDIESLIGNQRLVDDCLAPVMPVIQETLAEDSAFLRAVVYWAILYTVLFRQFAGRDIYYLFYERMKAAPREELDRLRAYLGDTHPVNEARLARLIERPSRSSLRQPPVSGYDDCTHRERELAGRLLQSLRLDRLYDEAGQPACHPSEIFAPSERWDAIK